MIFINPKQYIQHTDWIQGKSLLKSFVAFV